MRKKKVDLVFYSARKGARGLRKNASIFILWMGDAPLRAKNVFRSCFALTRSVMLYYICLFWFLNAKEQLESTVITVESWRYN